MKPSNKNQLVFMTIKPDGVKRRLIGEIFRRIENSGLILQDAKFIRPSRRVAAIHYGQKRDGSSGLTAQQAIEYLTSGCVLISVWKGKDAVRRMRKIVGDKTDPFSCHKGTIRRDFADDTLSNASRLGRAVRNVVHSSNNPRSALQEITLWFGKKWRPLND